MTARLATRHISRYSYEGPVFASHNEIRMTPQSDGRQSVLSAEVWTEPEVPLHRYLDYWSSVVCSFDLHDEHDELVVGATSLVETAAADPPPHHCWAHLRDVSVQDRYAELLAPTSYTPKSAELADLARSMAVGASPVEAIDAVVDLVRRTLTYEAGVTAVSTSALEAWQRRAGVCQDFAHLALVLVRALGIPARYVSGYVHPDDKAPCGVPVAATSHAWIEAYAGGWLPLDPTSGERVGERHVAVARGRDYGDVAPFGGVYHGGALAHLDVDVTVTLVATSAEPDPARSSFPT